MNEWFEILPEAILYLACGFSFVCGFYLLNDRRFSFFTDISFTIMLTLGFVNVNIFRVIPKTFTIENKSIYNIIIIVLGFMLGMIISFLYVKFNKYAEKILIKSGRKKTCSELFWYNLLDDNDKPMWVRLISNEKKIIIEGVLLEIDENKDDPNLVLGYYQKYNLDNEVIDGRYKERNNIKVILNPRNFDEIMLIYDKESNKIVKINID